MQPRQAAAELTKIYEDLTSEILTLAQSQQQETFDKFAPTMRRLEILVNKLNGHKDGGLPNAPYAH
jgi:hypothetical protein